MAVTVVVTLAVGFLAAWGRERAPWIGWGVVILGILGITRLATQRTPREAIVGTAAAALASAALGLAVALAASALSPPKTTVASTATPQSAMPQSAMPQSATPQSATPAQASARPGTPVLVQATLQPGGVSVQLSAPPQPGTVLRVWSQSPPALVELTRGTSTWNPAPNVRSVTEHANTVTISFSGPLAGLAVTDNTSRAPVQGALWAPSQAPSSQSGPVATQVEATIDAAEIAIGALQGPARSLGQAIILREVGLGTYRFALTFTDPATPGNTLQLRVQEPLLRQDILEVGASGQQTLKSLVVRADRFDSCAVGTKGFACQPTSAFVLPIDEARTLESNPAAVSVAPAPARVVNGQATSCYTVTASPADGPPPGETCVRSDGIVAFVRNDRTASVLTLQSMVATVDAAAFGTSL